jgi:hypothetical protein
MTDDKPSSEAAPDAVPSPPVPVDKPTSVIAPTPDVFSATAAPGVPTVLSQPTSQFGFGLSISPPPQPGDALLAKLKDDHLTKVIDQSESENKRKHQERIMAMVLMVAVAVLVVVFILALSYMFLKFQKSELLQPLLTLFLGFAGGVTSGFGIGRYTAPKGESEKK